MRNENSSFFLGLFWHNACRSGWLGTSIQSFMGRRLSRPPIHSAFAGMDGYLTTDFFFFLWYLAWVEWLLSKDFWLVSLLLYGPLARKSRLLLEIFFLLFFLTFWFAVFFSINSETYEAKRNPENMMLFFEHLISSWSAFSSPIKIIFIFILYVISRAFSYS